MHALVAFVALPGVVAFAVPLVVIAPLERGATFSAAGSLLVGVGILVLLATVREFYVAGRGTLAPWAPPATLVVTGLYRYSRNPMYVGVLLILAGWAAGFRSWPLAWYALAIAVAFYLRILLHEEPFLARTHGADWVAYRSRVPRWIGWTPLDTNGGHR